MQQKRDKAKNFLHLYRHPSYKGGLCCVCNKRPREYTHEESPHMCERCRESRVGKKKMGNANFDALLEKVYMQGGDTASIKAPDPVIEVNPEFELILARIMEQPEGAPRTNMIKAAMNMYPSLRSKFEQLIIQSSSNEPLSYHAMASKGGKISKVSDPKEMILNRLSALNELVDDQLTNTSQTD